MTHHLISVVPLYVALHLHYINIIYKYMLIKYAFCMRVDEVQYERYMCLSEQVPVVVCLSSLAQWISKFQPTKVDES